MPDVYLNRIATAVPDHDVHEKFVEYAPSLLKDEHNRLLFKRMADRSRIEHRYSVLEPHADRSRLDKNNFYVAGSFPGTEERMQLYEFHAFTLAQRAIDKLHLAHIKNEITHLIITTCTGFYAPGLDLQIIQHYGLNASVERTIIGFMGCYAAINALKQARHIVRSKSTAQVLVINLELCTLHLKDKDDLDQILSFLIFSDGCAASIISSQPYGLELQSFHSTIIPESNDLITWHIGGMGFDMRLSREISRKIIEALPSRIATILNNSTVEEFMHWAIHPGGSVILDAVEQAAALQGKALAHSRAILRNFGNMSSATVMFVLDEILQGREPGRGCAMSFGPGITVETMLFERSES